MCAACRRAERMGWCEEHTHTMYLGTVYRPTCVVVGSVAASDWLVPLSAPLILAVVQDRHVCLHVCKGGGTVWRHPIPQAVLPHDLTVNLSRSSSPLGRVALRFLSLLTPQRVVTPYNPPRCGSTPKPDGRDLIYMLRDLYGRTGLLLWRCVVARTSTVFFFET